MDQHQHARRGAGRTRLYVALIGVGACVMAAGVGAQENGPTTSGQICMQKIFGTPVASSNKVNCTANDIRLSRAISVSPNTCFADTTIPLLTATFEVIVTANARYDAGFFFRTDGGANARGSGINATGQCSLSALTPPPPPNAPALELDGDSCGDLNAGTYEVTFEIPNVECIADPVTHELKLPNCTSWHSNQGTVCEISEPFSTADATDFRPDTKSKCVCDDNFTVPVIVADAEIIVTKTANPTQVPETGGTVKFTVLVENAAENESVEISSIVDNMFGNVATATTLEPNDCDDLIGVTLAPGGTADCSFSATLMGDTGTPHTDIVTVTAIRDSNGASVSDNDDETVNFIDAFEDPSVSKVAKATLNCQMDARYEVVVSNNSTIDSLEVNSLIDDKFGDITTPHPADTDPEVAEVVSTDCNSVEFPFDTILPGGMYACKFVGRLTSESCAIDHTNTVTANVTDDDNVTSTPSESAVVTLTTTP